MNLENCICASCTSSTMGSHGWFGRHFGYTLWHIMAHTHSFDYGRFQCMGDFQGNIDNGFNKNPILFVEYL